MGVGSNGETNRERNKENALRQYRVYLAFENTREPGYVSEKILDGYKSGAVPVYWGAPDIGLHVPKGSFINIAPDLQDVSEAVASISNVLREPELWEKYQLWRDETSWAASIPGGPRESDAEEQTRCEICHAVQKRRSPPPSPPTTAAPVNRTDWDRQILG